MTKISLIPLLAIFFLPVIAAGGQCPVGCFCLAGYVTCSGLKSIPPGFPDDTRSVSITKIDADEIPAGIFDKLPALESIEIYSGSVGKISSGAFSSLSLLDLISLSEMTIGTIESYAFSNITDIGAISLYMSTVGTIEPYAFTDIFALDDIKLFMTEVTNIESFALSNIDELLHFSFYTNDVETMQPYAFLNFSNVHEFSMYLNNIGYLGCGSAEALLDQTYKHSFYSNSVNCSCDLTWISHDLSLKKYLFSNWCKVPNSEEKVFWEDVSLETLQCSANENYECPSAASVQATLATIGTTSPTSLVSSTSSSVSSSPATGSPSRLTESTSTETSSGASRQTFIPQRATGTESSSAASRTFLPRESISAYASSQVPQTTYLPPKFISNVVSSEKPTEARLLPGQSSPESVTKQIKTHSEFSTSPEATTTATKAAQFSTIDVKLDSTKYVPKHTNPNVVIPNKTEEIKAETRTKPSKNVQEPQNVSFKTDRSSYNVNGSEANHLCLFLIVLTLAIALI
ncbi:leucine-rich repeat-containing protein 4-like [Mercenaria mercenaria]|uniref:leucine-rich repeat-containing protein 4-like n=1 Tax=Mercenaria mercenaria TaxID=6596 RepID=UPI00234F5104|nr:leucine-rich repeat-containing protein 4-like [Mercenaria mercenaria]